MKDDKIKQHVELLVLPVPLLQVASYTKLAINNLHFCQRLEVLCWVSAKEQAKLKL